MDGPSGAASWSVDVGDAVPLGLLYEALGGGDEKGEAASERAEAPDEASEERPRPPERQRRRSTSC